MGVGVIVRAIILSGLIGGVHRMILREIVGVAQCFLKIGGSGGALEGL